MDLYVACIYELSLLKWQQLAKGKLTCMEYNASVENSPNVIRYDIHQRKSGILYSQNIINNRYEDA